MRPIVKGDECAVVYVGKQVELQVALRAPGIPACIEVHCAAARNLAAACNAHIIAARERIRHIRRRITHDAELVVRRRRIVEQRVVSRCKRDGASLRAALAQ